MYPPHFPAEVVLELSDDRFGGRTHGRKPTYQAGCHGPLCQKVERDTRRAWYRAKQKELGKEVQDRKAPGGKYPDDLLEEIQAWHERDREAEKALSTR